MFRFPTAVLVVDPKPGVGLRTVMSNGVFSKCSINLDCLTGELCCCRPGWDVDGCATAPLGIEIPFG